MPYKKINRVSRLTCTMCSSTVENKSKRTYKHSEETKRKMREAKKGRIITEEWKMRIGLANKGKKRSDETKKRISESKSMEKNPIWTHNSVGYNALHAWVKRHFWKTLLCQMCMLIPPHDLTNITNIYNRDFKNWRYYCRRCHMISDNRILNLKQFAV